MSSLRRHEGYLLIDNGEGNIPEPILAGQSLPMTAGSGMFEAPTITCSHCQVVVVINPLRNRERAYCVKCDHYVCDKCGVIKDATGICKTFKQIIEEFQEAEAKKSIITV